jgi:chromosome segregation and condensation protein ScpB
VTVIPQPHFAEALKRLGQVTLERELTNEALTVLPTVGYRGEATQAEVEALPAQQVGAEGTAHLVRLTRRHDRGLRSEGGK